MIVIDASALVDWLLQRPRRGPAVAARMLGARDVHTLDFADLEVVSALRRRAFLGELAVSRADLALRRLGITPLRRHSAAPFRRRVWELRDVLTPYDAAYVALAEVLEAPLVTTDGGLARSRGHRAVVVEA